jgi:mannitol/fructose-specific phosphotransferase system IIA component
MNKYKDRKDRRKKYVMKLYDKGRAEEGFYESMWQRERL